MKKITLLVVLLAFVVFVSGIMTQGKPAPAPANAATTPAPELVPPAKLEKFYGDIRSSMVISRVLMRRLRLLSLPEGKSQRLLWSMRKQRSQEVKTLSPWAI